jgi:2-iminobutanoate/2-iminopropanoate deaminase
MQFHMIVGGPRPVAPFSHAVETDGFVFVTGQMLDFARCTRRIAERHC